MIQLQFPQSKMQKKKKKKKKKKALKKYNKTQVQLRPPTRADELPFVDARYCKSLNSSIASRTSRRPKKQTKNAEIKLDHRIRSGFIQSLNLRSLTRRIVHVYRTGLLAAIMNLVSTS